MTKHDHHKCCEHKVLTYCKVCDVAYCEDCGREWGMAPQWSWTTTDIPFYSGSTFPSVSGTHEHEVFA